MEFGHIFKIIGRFSLPFLAFSAWAAFALPVEPGELEKAIQARRLQVEEFQKIAEEARSRGLRVYLAGGLAAGYGDFVKHQLLHEQGKLKVDEKRLKPLSTNIALPEQDFDLVVARADGAAESAEELKTFGEWLNQTLPRYIGSKSRWDLNGMKTSVGTRPAWSGDPDFFRQNNDSLSIGLIELTDPPAGASVIEEVGHVAKPTEGIFLKDMAGDSVHFLRSSEHAITQRAKAGDNPEILGAIRVLTKAFQFNKEIDPEELSQIAKIVAEFDPYSAKRSPYAYNWLLGRAKRLVMHAYDPEAAMRTIEGLGLKQKLLKIDPDTGNPNGLGWWMTKKPFGMKAPEAGKPTGFTASDFGISKVEHRTSRDGSRLISWRYDGVPRVFISRRNVKGENAVHGDGFYTTLPGSDIAWGTSNADERLIFNVDPQAQEGLDFTRIGQHGDGLLWSNGARLSVHAPEIHVQENCPVAFQKIAPKTSLDDRFVYGVIGTLGTGAAAVAGISIHDYFGTNQLRRRFGSFSDPATEAVFQHLMDSKTEQSAFEEFDRLSPAQKDVVERDIELRGSRPDSQMFLLKILMRDPRHSSTRMIMQRLWQSNYPAVRGEAFRILSARPLDDFDLGGLLDMGYTEPEYATKLIQQIPSDKATEELARIFWRDEALTVSKDLRKRLDFVSTALGMRKLTRAAVLNLKIAAQTNFSERAIPAFILLKRSSEPRTEDFIPLLSGTADPEIPALAAEEVGRRGIADTDLARLAAELSQVSDPKVWKPICDALSKLPDGKSRQILELGAQNANPNVRELAQSALASHKD